MRSGIDAKINAILIAMAGKNTSQPPNPQRISYQGIEGSYSHSLAARHIAPEASDLRGFLTVYEALEAVENGQCDITIIPIENNIGGRVAEIHHLLLNTKLIIIAEYCLHIEHCLLARRGSTLSNIATVYSHPQALLQCRRFLRTHRIQAVVEFDTAVAAKRISTRGTATEGAVAAFDCAAIYELEVLKREIADRPHNTTRFIAMSTEAQRKRAYKRPISALLFQLRSVPAALYKALGGFATNGINLLKLESYVDQQGFETAQFYTEIDADIHASAGVHALEELRYFAEWVRILGVFEQNRTPIVL